MSLIYPLAPMSPLIRKLTIVALLIPFLFAIIGIILRQKLFFAIFLFIIIIYVSAWVWFRPSQFVVSNQSVDIIFPLRKRKITMQNISNVRILNKETFEQEYGWAMRIGVGGLWGGFGWLWTQKQGFLEFYISQTDNFVLLELFEGNNLLLTPENRQAMAETIRSIINQS